MSISDIVKREVVRGFARRVGVAFALLLIAAILSFLGISKANAQTPEPVCSNPQWSGDYSAPTGLCDSREQADSMVRASLIAFWPAEACGPIGEITVATIQGSGSNAGFFRLGAIARRTDGSGCGIQTPTYRWYGDECPAGKFWNDVSKKCEKDCTQAAPIESPSFYPGQGGLTCQNGCEYVWMAPIAGESYAALGSATFQNCSDDQGCDPGYYRPSNAVPGQMLCLPVDPPTCPAGQVLVAGKCVKNRECPAGKVLDANGLCKEEEKTCPAGQVKNANGQCVDGQCPAGQVRGPDGTCKKDGDGDGEADEDDDTFSGGDDCSSPPQCSGSPILCGQARIQWRIECNTRRNVNISGGSCEAIPICTGEKCDALEYAQLLQGWRAACALEKLAAQSEAGAGEPGSGGGPGGTGDGGNGECPDGGVNQAICEIRNFFSGLFDEAAGLDTDQGDLADPSEAFQTSPQQVELDSSGFLGGGGCPPPPTFMGYSLDEAGNLCMFAGLIGVMVLVGAYAQAAYIIGRS